jgi:hypothetical protein
MAHNTLAVGGVACTHHTAKRFMYRAVSLRDLYCNCIPTHLDLGALVTGGHYDHALLCLAVE